MIEKVHERMRALFLKKAVRSATYGRSVERRSESIASRLRISFSCAARRSAISLKHLAGLGVFDRHDAEIRQDSFAWVFNWHCHEIVAPIRLPQREAQFRYRFGALVRSLKIRKQKGNATPFAYVIREP
jgi:hypothetical protein